MPGLVGCVSHQFLNRDLLRVMSGPMLHRTDYQVHEHVDENFIAAVIDLASDQETGFIRSGDGRYALLFFGAFYESWAFSKS